MIELGVLSLWTGTPNFRLTRGSAMIYSAAVAYAAAAMADTELVTDSRGLEIADRLGWDMRSFSMALEDFCPKSARHIWMLGKIQAQLIQTAPFVHIDLDFLLLRPLPPRLLTAAVVVQSKDHPRSYHDPFNRRIAEHCGITPHAIAYNTGLVGGNDLRFMRDYAEQSMRLAITASEQFDHGGCVSIICEQMLLGDMARRKRLRVETAIPMPTHSDKTDQRDVWFVHLWGLSKENPVWLKKIEDRFAEDHPDAHARFLRGLNWLIKIA